MESLFRFLLDYSKECRRNFLMLSKLDFFNQISDGHRRNWKLIEILILQRDFFLGLNWAKKVSSKEFLNFIQFFKRLMYFQ